MEYDAEIEVNAKRATVRCLTGDCQYSFTYHATAPCDAVRSLREAFTDHIELHHKELKRRPNFDLRFADGVTV